MKTKPVIILFGVLFFLFSCERNQTTTVTKENFSGYVQKGPFLNGSSVTISELDNNFNQTGRSYSTTVANNSGSFEQKQIQLITSFVQLKADGYYFNEVTGESSTGQLTLYALADIAGVNSANVNVLTHLEKSRVEYLVQHTGLSFIDAKKQAQKEVLAIFSLELPSDSTSESLNLSASGDDNAVLLAVSCILQGPLSTAQMSELMANIITDIAADGKLDNTSLGSELIDNARLIDLSAIRQNLENEYNRLELTNAVIPDFEKHVQYFLANSQYTPVKIISYPVAGEFGLNLLNDTVSKIPPGAQYSMKANLPQGTDLKIVLKGDENYLWGISIFPSPLNWLVSTYNTTTMSQEFNVIESNKPNDLNISFSGREDLSSTIVVEYYENNAATPTRTKTITLGRPLNGNISYPYYGKYGANLLNDTDTTFYAYHGNSLNAKVPGNKTLKVVLKGGTWVLQGDTAVSNWTIGTYNDSSKSQEFTVTQNNKTSDLGIIFTAPGTAFLEYYVNGETSPGKVKQLIIY